MTMRDRTRAGGGPRYPLALSLLIVLAAGACTENEVPATSSPSSAASSTPTRMTADQLRRPLHFPSLQAGKTCPRDAGSKLAHAFGKATGPGPIYPVYGSRQVVGISRVNAHGRWGYVKTLWVAKQSVYDGPAIVRGHQIDGPGEIRFGKGPTPDAEMLLPEDPVDQPDAPGWNEWPSYSRIQTGQYGCYAYQVDGLDFTETVVFEVGPERF